MSQQSWFSPVKVNLGGLNRHLESKRHDFGYLRV